MIIMDLILNSRIMHRQRRRINIYVEQLRVKANLGLAWHPSNLHYIMDLNHPSFVEQRPFVGLALASKSVLTSIAKWTQGLSSPDARGHGNQIWQRRSSPEVWVNRFDLSQSFTVQTISKRRNVIGTQCWGLTATSQCPLRPLQQHGRKYGRNHALHQWYRNVGNDTLRAQR